MLNIENQAKVIKKEEVAALPDLNFFLPLSVVSFNGIYKQPAYND